MVVAVGTISVALSVPLGTQEPLHVTAPAAEWAAVMTYVPPFSDGVQVTVLLPLARLQDTPGGLLDSETLSALPADSIVIVTSDGVVVIPLHCGEGEV